MKARAARRLLADLLAVGSGALVLSLVTREVWQFHQGDHFEFTSGELVHIGSAGTLTLVLWGWMIVDCIRELARAKTPRLVGWLATMIVFGGASLAYYFLEYRRRLRP